MRKDVARDAHNGSRVTETVAESRCFAEKLVGGKRETRSIAILSVCVRAQDVARMPLDIAQCGALN